MRTPSRICLPGRKEFWQFDTTPLRTLLSVPVNNFPKILYRLPIREMGRYSFKSCGFAFFGTSVINDALIVLGLIEFIDDAHYTIFNEILTTFEKFDIKTIRARAFIFVTHPNYLSSSEILLKETPSKTSPLRLSSMNLL